MPIKSTTQTRLIDKKWFWIIVGVAFLLLFYALKSILAPFLVALFVGYLCAPVVEYLQKKGINRAVAACIVIIVLTLMLIGFLLVFLPMIQTELVRFMTQIPVFLENFNRRFGPSVSQFFGQTAEFDARSVKDFINSNLSGISNMSLIILRYIGKQGAFLVALGFNILMVPIILFYALRDWNGFVDIIDRLIPRDVYEKIKSILMDMNELLSQTVRGQLLVIFIQSVLYALALSFAGLEFAFAIGLITGILSIIPYIGFTIGFTMAVLAAIIQFDSIWQIAGVILALGVVQVFESFFLTPRIVGDRMGLHPVGVIFALLAFGELFGFTGILIALPVTSLIVVLLRHLKEAYLDSHFYLGQR